MLYRFLDRDKVSRPAGFIFLALGLALAGFGYLFRQVPALHGGINPDHVDFMMGMSMGIGAALAVVGISAVISGRKKSEPS